MYSYYVLNVEDMTCDNLPQKNVTKYCWKHSSNLMVYVKALLALMDCGFIVLVISAASCVSLWALVSHMMSVYSPVWEITEKVKECVWSKPSWDDRIVSFRNNDVEELSAIDLLMIGLFTRNAFERSVIIYSCQIKLVWL